MKDVDSFVMEDYCVLVTASNDGFIKMWKIHLKEARPLLVTSTKFNIYFCSYILFYNEISIHVITRGHIQLRKAEFFFFF